MILGIDTTTDWSSVALEDKSIVWRGNQNQSMELLVKIEQLMKELNVCFEDIKGVVVINGPGSYTGIRIGVSVANTIGMLMNIPVKGVDGLEAQVVAGKFQGENKKIVSLISAGGGRVYGRKIEIARGGSSVLNCEKSDEYFVGEVRDFLRDTDKDNFIVGEINEDVKNWIKSSGYRHLVVMDERNKIGRAGGAVELFQKLPSLLNNNVIPLYLREAVRKK